MSVAGEHSVPWPRHSPPAGSASRSQSGSNFHPSTPAGPSWNRPFPAVTQTKFGPWEPGEVFFLFRISVLERSVGFLRPLGTESFLPLNRSTVNHIFFPIGPRNF